MVREPPVPQPSPPRGEEQGRCGLRDHFSSCDACFDWIQLTKPGAEYVCDGCERLIYRGQKGLHDMRCEGGGVTSPFQYDKNEWIIHTLECPSAVHAYLEQLPYRVQWLELLVALGKMVRLGLMTKGAAIEEYWRLVKLL